MDEDCIILISKKKKKIFEIFVQECKACWKVSVCSKYCFFQSVGMYNVPESNSITIVMKQSCTLSVVVLFEESSILAFSRHFHREKASHACSQKIHSLEAFPLA